VLLDTPDGKLHYELRGDGPLLVLAGAPMDADAFIPAATDLAEHFTVLTTDPRGINRSVLNDPEQDSTPEQRGADLAALIEHVGLGRAAVLGSSGGACSVLALAQAHPELVGPAIAHEPPLYDVLPDAEELNRAGEEMIALYQAGDRVQAWRRFMEVAAMNLPEEMFQQFFGRTPPPQPLADERFQFAHMLRATVHFRPDEAALRGADVVLGIGEQSAGTLCDRSTRALAGRLGLEPTLFPGGHTGFLEDPPAFAARLREILTG
jgi:pimeloyl-ACP methyl ester carboxylesterase